MKTRILLPAAAAVVITVAAVISYARGAETRVMVYGSAGTAGSTLFTVAGN